MATLKEVEDGKVWAFLGIFLGLIGFLIVLLAKRENTYAMFYAKQSLVLFITSFTGWIVLVILGMILGAVPVLGFLITGLISAVFYIFLVVLWVMGWVKALSGKEEYLPVIGKYADKLNL
jgi:uncharacterized membrane protein